MVLIKRVYEKLSKDDGFRILVDRLWPRGLTKAAAKVDLWLKDIAPSNELRKWFAHENSKCAEFKRRYFKELKEKKGLLETIRQQASKGTVTLVYAAKDTVCNNATALKEFLDKL
jgi:uncharacterized protein YeaO (DUF488 family)